MIFGVFKNQKFIGKTVMKPFVRAYRRIYLWDQYNKAYKIHKKYHDDERYHIFRFEDMVTYLKESIMRMCNFLNVPYLDDMLFPPVVDSSFDDKTKIKGLNSKAATRWKKTLSVFEKTFIRFILRKQMQAMGC
jgi:hypothetical protein